MTAVVRDVNDRKHTQEWLASFNECLLTFGPDPRSNINSLTALCGDALVASSAFYVHFGEQNEAWGCWNPPENWDPGELSEGQLLFESAQRGALEPAVIRDLSRSEFAQTDPSVQRYNWQTCIGTLALTAAAPVGALTLVFTYDRSPSDEDLRIVQLTTSAIVVEESRWAAQQETKQREVQQATMFDAAHDAIMTLDPEGIITYWNRGAERLYGWTTQEAEGQNANTLLRTTFPESREELWPKLMESGLWEGELTNVTRDGVPITVASSWTLLKDESGNASAILEISSDVTERKKAESALHDAQEELRRTEAIFEALQVGIVLIDPITCKIVDINTTAAHLFGAPKKAIIGSVCHQFICPAEVGSCPIIDLGQRVDKAERVLLTADGKSRPILKSVSRITLGGHDYLLESFVDISDRKQIERALLDREAYYRAIFESTAAGLAIVEEDMTVAMANSKLEQLTGFSKNEVEGLKPWTEFVAPEDLERIKTYHRARRRDEASAPEEYEFRLLTKDGGPKQVFATAALVPGTKRSIVSIVDVTALKTAQEAVRKQAAMLDAAHDCIVVFDEAGTLKYLNRGAERFYGWTKREAEGQNVHALLQTTFPESREALFLKLLKHGTWEGELVHVARDGRSVMVASSWTLLKNEKGGTYEVLEICSDITERKQAGEALNESERHIRELADALPVVVFETDATGRFTFINATAFDMLGYTKEELEAGMSLFQLIAPADRDRIGTVLSDRKSWEYLWVELTALRKDGSTFPLSVRGVPIMRDGTVVGIRGIAVDITDRKRGEEALASELAINSTIARLYTPLIAPTSTIEDIALAILDGAKGLTGSEAGFVSLIDLANRDMIAFGLTQMMVEGCAVPEEQQRIRFPIGPDGSYSALWGYALNTKKGFYTNAPATHPASRGTPDGHAPLAQLLAVPALVGEEVVGQIAIANPGRDYTERDLRAVERLAEVYALGAVRTRAEDALKQARDDVQVLNEALESTNEKLRSDITERKKAEAALAESEAKLRTTFATMADGIVMVGLNRKVTDCNEALLRMTQRSKEEVVGKPLLDLFAPEFRSQIFEKHPELMEKGNILSVAKLLRKSGESVDVEANVSLIKDAAGQYMASVAVLRDVTERKQMEQQLDETLADLKRSNAELEQFAYSASHDLQEPLRMIASYTQIMEEDYKGKLDADADQYIAFTVEGAKRMQTLIDDLLAYSRVGTRGEPFIPTSMDSVLSEAIANLQVAIEESHAVVTHDQLPTVLGDESQLIQLLQNLLGNAIKFRGDDAPVIHVGVEETKDGWVFSVHDNGIGIDMKNAERIFTVFQRLHARDEYPGTGIGLAIVKKIVERHGGRIWVESALAQGSTFYFTLQKREDNVL